MQFKQTYALEGVQWMSNVRPTLKFSNVLNLVAGAFQDELNPHLNRDQQSGQEGTPMGAQDDSHRLACMLSVGTADSTMESAKKRDPNPWMERAKLHRRQLALKTRQCKETEKIAIELSNKVDLLIQERVRLKCEHAKSLSFSAKKISAVKERANHEILALKRQITVLERKIDTSENLNSRMIAELHKEIASLKKTLMEKDDKIERLELAKARRSEATTNDDGGGGSGDADAADMVLEDLVATAEKGQPAEAWRSTVYLDGYPINLDQISPMDEQRGGSQSYVTPSPHFDLPP